ncbi:DNA polymerase III subunit chi [Celeribacter neptunius]|uniref:DNA polymerase III, chi subunit n=1 Tax=Celeribacter neptunius TaxID=588602 RepID=A0A1I3KFQ4_9RHOB|nr:DNA polymerase III subunit chi [Celeribacter neptunius]SFI71170.1 DNA polymerase III, chi subunit [Celeribacter neptunius]
MGAVYFYHLTRAPLAETLGTLAEKSLSAGWRVEVRGRSDEMLRALDQALWLREGFLPHGMAGGPHDADQPILMTAGVGGNAASCIMSVGGAELTVAEIQAADRACILFDGYDEAAVQHARVQWKSLTDGGAEAQYWSEESGRWEKKAESKKG